MYYKFRFRIPKEAKGGFKANLQNNADLACEIFEENGNIYAEISNNTSFFNFSMFLIELLNIKKYLINNN
jgi:hypothetical protein